MVDLLAKTPVVTEAAVLLKGSVAMLKDAPFW